MTYPPNWSNKIDSHDTQAPLRAAIRRLYWPHSRDSSREAESSVLGEADSSHRPSDWGCLHASRSVRLTYA